MKGPIAAWPLWSEPSEITDIVTSDNFQSSVYLLLVAGAVFLWLARTVGARTVRLGAPYVHGSSQRRRLRRTAEGHGASSRPVTDVEILKATRRISKAGRLGTG